MRTAERLWYGSDVIAQLTRAALWPAEIAFRGAVGVRNALYDHHLLGVASGALPAVSVGNLSVGGTGKTPVAAWFAAQLSARGAHPAILLRGYGDDEPKVHERLNPTVPVVIAADRVGGMLRARALGADSVVLDDAFQHRRAPRVADVVLVGAERGLAGRRLLPAGPLREPVGSLRRASLVVVTRKSASLSAAAGVLEAACAVSHGPGALVHLALGGLVPLDGGPSRPLTELSGLRVALITGIGEPGVLADQLRAAGAVVDEHAFADHHDFTPSDLARTAAAAGRGAAAICTLKDAVKIGLRWPGPVPLWYVSQHVVVERGQEALDQVLGAVLSARRTDPLTAG